ncbi:alpha/beta fold hydrolase [Haliea sp. E17]|uniref:alpha/beta fold hydrolase n=1 Tax=Haliea sp. E17 TaxID=3401576 RepID=UPI003AAB7C67
MPANPTEIGWEVDGLWYAGLAWGNPHHPPLLALHGWLDNAASFARLAPLLDDFHVVAVDLSGHGRSSWRSRDATYQIYDDLPQLLSILDQLGWQHCHLMGHSRGAIIATLFAACFPERIARLVLLDGLSPEATGEEAFVTQLRQFVEQRERYLGRQPTVYPSAERAMAVRTANGLPLKAAELMLPRSLRAEGAGVCWTSDPRLRGASAVKLSVGQIEAMLRAVTAPTLVLVAETGLVPLMSSRFAELVAQMAAARMESQAGGHHFHLEDGVARIAGTIQTFLQTN